MAIRSYVTRNPVEICLERDLNPESDTFMQVKSIDDKPPTIFHVIPPTARDVALYIKKQQWAVEKIRQAGLEETMETVAKTVKRVQDETTTVLMEYIPKIENLWMGEEWRDEITSASDRRLYIDNLLAEERASLQNVLRSDAQLRALSFRRDPVGGTSGRTKPGGEGKKRPKRRR